ncbi:immunoglobulin-like domain-containing protein, partial [Enterococcus faecalis]
TDGKTESGKVAVTVQARKNTPPTITAPDQSYFVGDKLNPMKGVSASDAEDGDLTSKVTYNASGVDMDKPGVYSIFYSVTDSQGAQATATAKITVKEKDHGSSPVITATDKRYKVGSTLIPELGVSASDAEDGDLTSKITYDTSKVNMNQVGFYPLTMRVADSDGNETTKTINIQVMASVARGPRIDGATDKTLQLGESFDSAAGVTATGFDNSDLTDELIIQGTVNTNREGVYQVVYTVADKSGRVAQVVRTITVRKQTGSSPTIQATDKTYAVGSTLLPSLGVTASDQE